MGTSQPVNDRAMRRVIDASHSCRRYSGRVFDEADEPLQTPPPPTGRRPPRRASSGIGGWAVAAAIVLILAAAAGLLTAWFVANSQSVAAPVAVASPTPTTPSSCCLTPPPTSALVSSEPTEGPRRTPTPPATAEVTPEPYVYVVQPGDHLVNIADLYGVDVNDIIELNAIKNPNRLLVGQQLLIPGYGVPPPTKKPR